MATDATGLGPVSFATKSARIVAGAGISKATARAATDDERWRYGVEVRRLNSRWCPQKRAPHYPVPEPYVYRKQPQSLAWHNSEDDLKRIGKAYTGWLAERDAPKPQPKVKPVMDNIVTLPPADEREAAPSPMQADEANEVARRHAAAALLHDISGQYGPRRAHKLRAMAEWLIAEPAVRIARQA